MYSVSEVPMKSLPAMRRRIPSVIGFDTLRGRGSRGTRASIQRNASSIGFNSFPGRTPGCQ